jgi:hypothetical protein
VAAWWVEADQAEGVVKQARKNGGDIPAAARELGVTLTAHDVVIARAKQRPRASTMRSRRRRLAATCSFSIMSTSVGEVRPRRPVSLS